MAVDATELRAWSRSNHAAWEVTPLVELYKGERLQVGFELDLYARLPPRSEADEQAVEALWDRLREIAESLLPLVGSGARFEVEPFDDAPRLRPETQFAPEVLLKARLFHPQDYFAPVAEADRERIRPLEARLRDLGLREHGW